MGKYKTNSLTDYKRNNKIILRNFSESCDMHDLIKLLLVRMLRRKHPDSRLNPIYTELEREEGEIPDIWAKLKKDIVVYEIQKDNSNKWTKKVNTKYEDVDLVIVPIKELEKKYKKMLDELKEELSKYII